MGKSKGIFHLRGTARFQLEEEGETNVQRRIWDIGEFTDGKPEIPVSTMEECENDGEAQVMESD